MPTEMADPGYRRDLGDGLSLRWSTKGDAEAIAELASSVFRNSLDDPLNTPLAQFIYEQMSGEYPLMSPGDFALVEETKRHGNRLVACTCLWQQEWEYEGIPVSVGRPEWGATDPSYRNRGLGRAIFELIHARSAAQGHLVQAGAGIPYYCRRFGYEYALDLDGSYIVYLPFIPPVPEETTKHYTLRDARLEDLPFIQELYDRQRTVYSVSTIIDQRWWRYQIQTWRTSRTGYSERLQIIVDATGSSCGYLITRNVRADNYISVWDLAVAPNVNLQEIMPPLLRELHILGMQMPIIYRPSRNFDYKAPALSGIRFILGKKHPVYDVLMRSLNPKYETPSAWYVRVANLPIFIRHIAPALERRLADSMVVSYSGELKLNFYRGGLRMVFENGRLMTVEDWQRPVWYSNENGGFPPLVFLQLLFGYRSLDELRHAFPDVWIKEESELLLKMLFPARSSRVMRMG